MAFITVFHGNTRFAAELEAYNYSRTTLLFETSDFSDRLISVLEVAEDATYSAQYQADRYSSGLFGARVCEDIDGVRAALVEYQ